MRDAELPVLNAAIQTATQQLRRSSVSRVALGDAPKAAAIARFLASQTA